MNQWSVRRKRIIFLSSLLCLVIIIGVPLFFFLHKTPTCSDGSQNGDETGVDCGGSCKLICKNDSLPMLTKGDPRILKIATTTYETVVNIQNPNVSASVSRADYTFRIFSASSSVPIKIIKDSTYIPRGANFALFEGPFDLGEFVPSRATFEWDQDSLDWQKDLSKIPDLPITGSVLSNALTSPRLEAVIHNDTLNNVSNIELVALISDQNGNIIASSKTFVDIINPGNTVNLVFTWPAPFASTSTIVNILPRILPDKSYIR